MPLEDQEQTANFIISEHCLTEILSADLLEIRIPEDVSSIASEAFHHCKTAEKIEIPDSVTSIGERAFSGLNRLKFVHLPVRLPKLEKDLFSGCAALETVELPADLTEIGENVFKGCTSLKSMRLPEGVKKLESSCFSNCTSLESVEFSALEAMGNLVFAGCQSLKRMILPDTITSIGTNAFKNCYSLEFVHLPNGLKEVPTQLFAGCRKLETVEVSDKAVMGKSVFLRVLSADNWECFVRRDGVCRRKLINAMEYDPHGAFDLLPEGGAGIAEILPQRTVFIALNAIWEYTQFDTSAYDFQIRIYAACMHVARILTGSHIAALMAVAWHLRGLLLLWRYRHEDDIEKIFPEALSATLNAIGGSGSHRVHNDQLVKETFKLFLGSANEDLKTTILSQLDRVLGIENDFSRESPFDVRYCAGIGETDYWTFADVMGYLTRNKLGVHIPIPEVHSDDLEDWCIAWSKPLSDYHHAVILFELPPTKDSAENRHAVAIANTEQIRLLLEVFQEVEYRACFVWMNGSRMPLFIM